MSRNYNRLLFLLLLLVTPREGRVSRNDYIPRTDTKLTVTPREGRVSRNQLINSRKEILDGHAPRGACE